MLRRIFDTFVEMYCAVEKPTMHLLPASFEKNILAANSEQHRIRLLCDYIAGMTDGFAIRTYKRLFDPDFGSMVDLI